tara:strand:+ start:815 stop:982 length:168 start_codon:yes stop_codon:yes gene_type:complete
MSKFKKQVALSLTMALLSSASAIPSASTGVYDLKPKNSFRGGAIGKGGKIKYQRR